MKEYKITDSTCPHPSKVELGDKITLKKQTQEVVKCQETGVKMLNIDADQLEKGDLTFIKKLGLTISNPETDKPVALGVDFKPDSWGHKIAEFFKGKEEESAEITPSPSEPYYSSKSRSPSPEPEDDDDDSHFFSSGGFLGGSSSSGGFGGGFGGFGGGSFGGGGISRGF